MLTIAATTDIERSRWLLASASERTALLAVRMSGLSVGGLCLGKRSVGGTGLTGAASVCHALR